MYKKLLLVALTMQTALYAISYLDIQKINQRNNMIILQDNERQAHKKRQEVTDTHIIDTGTYALTSEELLNTNCFTLISVFFVPNINSFKSISVFPSTLIEPLIIITFLLISQFFTS